MNILNKTKTYLVGNLEATKDGSLWRLEREKDLQTLGVECFNPNRNHFINQATETEEDRELLKKKREEGDWSYVSNYMKGVIRRDLRFVDMADFIVGHIEPEMPTWGTTHEIVVSSLQRKPIILTIDDLTKFPLWMSGIVNMNLVFEKWEDAFQYLKKIDSEVIKINPKYWKILTK